VLTCWLSGRMHAVWSPDGSPGRDRLPAISSLAVGSGRLPRTSHERRLCPCVAFSTGGCRSGCQAWSYVKRFGSSVAQPCPEAKYHGGRTEEDGREPDSEVAEHQGDDAGGQQHHYPGHVVSGGQLGPQPAIAPKVSVLGEPLELRWIIHPDRDLTACGAQTVLAVMLTGGRSGGVLAQVPGCPHGSGRAGQLHTSPRLGIRS
jgi:hypothetical protein